MAVMSYIQAVTLAMKEEMERDESICLRRRRWKEGRCL